MWDERFSDDSYAYGTKPNVFLEEQFAALPKGKLLSLAEGEGRNAVFLASRGYDVTAVDGSLVGLRKAAKLAEQNGVHIEIQQADLAEFPIEPAAWDSIVSIFCPLPKEIREPLHRKVVRGLKPGGAFLLVGYTPKQLALGTGGGNSLDVMMTSAMLRSELAGLEFLHLEELEREVIEGTFHTGIGAVIEAIAVKKPTE